MGRLDGKVAIITGGARGQGEATARLFVAEGARVLIADVLGEPGEKLAAELGEAALFQRLDVTDAAGWQETVALAARHFGRLDILVNNAGILLSKTVPDTSEEDFRRVLDVNLVGAFLGMKAAAPVMAETGGGAIVNISSVQGLMGRAGTSAYTASKFGLRGLTKTVAMEFGALGIRVNSIHPGGVDTPMLRGATPGFEVSREILDRAHANVALGRVAVPEDVARTTLFLASDDAAYITGAELAVDGGMTAGFTGLPGRREA